MVRTMTDFEVKDFQKDVIETSQQVPVLVDFWAEWCGPCKMLAPVLEKVAQEADGEWKLVKVDTEKHPDLADRFQISGIPNLKLFHHGKVVNELSGFVPEGELKRWLKESIPSEASLSADQARELLDSGKTSEAAAILEKIVEEDGDSEKARVYLAEALYVDQPDRAQELIARIFEDSDYYIQASAINELADICRIGAGELPDEKGRSEFLKAISALRDRDYDAAMKNVIQSMKAKPEFSGGIATRLGKAIIKQLGIRHPTIDKHYRAFSSLLHA